MSQATLKTPSLSRMALACILGVALVGVLEGIIIAVGLSILQFFERSWRPLSAVLGQVEGLAGYHDIERYPQASLTPGLLVFAEFKDPVQDKIVRYGLLETIDHRHFYATIEVAVEAFGQEP